MNDWMDLAACVGMPPSLFFPELGENANEARAVCARCPVTCECRAYAEQIGAREGIWAGESLRDRQRRRRAVKARQPSPVRVSSALVAIGEASRRAKEKRTR